MQLRHAVSVLLAIATFGPSPLAGQIEGRYRFVICVGPCLSTDTTRTIASGEIVLFPDSNFAESIPDELLAELHENSFWLVPRYRPDFNACFRVSRAARSVGGHELFAGIIPRGLTLWSFEDGEIRFSLYRSSDGGFRVTGRVADGRIEGIGEQSHGLDPRPPARGFLAERIGPPSAALCGSNGDR